MLRCFCVAIVALATGTASAQQEIKRMPWHLVDIWWDTGEDRTFEGDFVSVRRPYEWSKGTYTFRVLRMDREMVEGRPFTWVGAFVYSHEKDENVFIGALRFPGENLVLDRKIASFVEVYGRAIPVEQIPKVNVTFDNLRVNGLPVENPTATVIYPDGVPDYANATGEDGHLVVRVGEPVEDRVQRRVKVLPAASDG